jgi:hypothetical protein
VTLSFGASNANWRSIQESIVAATEAGIFVVAAAGMIIPIHDTLLLLRVQGFIL